MHTRLPTRPLECQAWATCRHVFPVALLTLGAHEPQGYSSCVCLCVSGLNVCVSASISPNSNELAKKTYGSPQHCNCLIIMCFFSVKQPFEKLQNSSGSHVGTPIGHFACPCRFPSVHPFTCDIALDHVVFFYRLCLAQRYTAHGHIFITGRWPQPQAIVRLKEGMYSAQYTMQLKKVCPQCSAVVSIKKLLCDCGRKIPY